MNIQIDTSVEIKSLVLCHVSPGNAASHLLTGVIPTVPSNDVAI